MKTVLLSVVLLAVVLLAVALLAVVLLAVVLLAVVLLAVVLLAVVLLAVVLHTRRQASLNTLLCSLQEPLATAVWTLGWKTEVSAARVLHVSLT